VLVRRPRVPGPLRQRRGIAEAAQAARGGLADAALLRAAGGDPHRHHRAAVFRLAGENDPPSVAVVEEACQAMGA
jgi:hypothetical protein